MHAAAAGHAGIHGISGRSGSVGATLVASKHGFGAQLLSGRKSIRDDIGGGTRGLSQLVPRLREVGSTSKPLPEPDTVKPPVPRRPSAR